MLRYNKDQKRNSLKLGIVFSLLLLFAFGMNPVEDIHEWEGIEIGKINLLEEAEDSLKEKEDLSFFLLSQLLNDRRLKPYRPQKKSLLFFAEVQNSERKRKLFVLYNTYLFYS